VVDTKARQAACGYFFSVTLMETPSSCVVYTPKKLADAMAHVLDPRPREQFLEPCIGSGALVRALARKGVPAKRIRALDLDPAIRDSDRYARVLRGADFLHWATHTSERFDKIIANPPYLALSRLGEKLRENAQQVRNPFSGETLPLRGNYWHSFLCASVQLLKRDGSLAFLLPAAWDYSNYADLLRKELPTHFECFDIHRSYTPLFKGVQEGSVVLVAQGFRREHKRFHRGEYFEVKDLLRSLDTTGSTGGPAKGHGIARPHEPHFRRLGELVEIPIGAVCGDAQYFLLTETERREHKLPLSACVPVLSRSSHVRSGLISRRLWEKLRIRGERVWLFRPDKRHRHHKAVQRYLRLPLEVGGCDRTRFKVRARATWYQTYLPAQVEGFISGMSPVGPWISLSRMPGLNATNTLYVVRFKSATTLAQRAAIGLSLVSSSARQALARVGRRYPDGLLKFEPGDLKDIPVPVVTRLRGVTRRYQQIVRHLVEGNVAKAQELADKWLEDAKARGLRHKQSRID
jgi:adenine-specific DNA-methyltransferase